MLAGDYVETHTTTCSKVYEHICLTTEEWEKVEQTSVDAEIEQRSGRSLQRITIFNGTYLGIRTLDKHSEEFFRWISLVFVDLQPVRQLEGTGKVAITTLVALGAVALFVIYRISSDLGFGWSIALSTLLAVTLAGLGLFVQRRFEESVYLTRHGRVQILRLSKGRTQGNCSKAFVRALSESRGVFAR